MDRDSCAKIRCTNVKLFEAEVIRHSGHGVKELRFNRSLYRLHRTVAKYTSNRSAYPLRELVPRYDVHVKKQQLVSTLEVRGFVIYIRSEIPRLWISNPCLKQNIHQTVFSDPGLWI